jgi:glycosyltransferase 2 family protein
MVALVTLARDYRVARKISLAAGLLAVALSIAIALLFAVLLLPFGALQSVRRFWYVMLLIPMLTLLLHPPWSEP